MVSTMALLGTSTDDEPIGKFLADIIVGLADEGIPIRAIARATKHPSDSVRRVVHDACGSGSIAHVPRDDWAPGEQREDRMPVADAELDYDTTIMRISTVFRITRAMARFMYVLMRRQEVSKTALHQVVEQGRDPSKDATDVKIVDVMIHSLRKRLRNLPEPIIIDTRWAFGYYMKPEYQQVAFKMLNDAQAVVTMREEHLQQK